MQGMRRALAVLPLLLLTACATAPEPAPQQTPEQAYLDTLAKHNASTGDPKQDIRLADKVCFHWNRTADSYDQVAAVMRSINGLDAERNAIFMAAATAAYCPDKRHMIPR